MVLAISYAVLGSPLTRRAAEWFIAYSMCVLAMLKLQNVESFSNSLVNYRLLAKWWVTFSYMYPYPEVAALTGHNGRNQLDSGRS